MSKVDDLDLTLLPLDYFRKLVGVDPYHFWQMTHTLHPLDGYSQIYPHERWQHTTVLPIPSMPERSAKRGPGRYDILEAIARAEEKIADFHALNTWCGLKYTYREEIRLKKPRQEVWYSRTPYKLTTRWWHVNTVGVQTWTSISSGVALVYDASDDVTLTVNVGSVSTGEVVVCYPGTQVRIRPAQVTKVGNVATVTLKKWLCGKPADWETGDPIDASDVLNLLTEVDVYRLWMDTSEQIILVWEPEASRCSCSGAGCPACAGSTRDACALRGDYSIGVVAWQTATYDAVDARWELLGTWPYSRFPDLAYISYLHGFPTGSDRYMSSKWQKVVSYLAAAELPSYVVDATSQPDILYDWRMDLARQEEGSRFSVSPSGLDNPFGTRRGQVYAWKAVKEACGD